MLAARYRIPVILPQREFVEAGGLAGRLLPTRGLPEYQSSPEAVLKFSDQVSIGN